jgi:hypothetical protein
LSALACPSCGHTDDLFEHTLVPAIDRVTFNSDREPDYPGPSGPQLDYDNATMVSLECANCEWRSDPDPDVAAVDQLINAPQVCGECDKPIRTDAGGVWVHWSTGVSSCWSEPGELEDLERQIEQLRSRVATPADAEGVSS